MKATRFKQKMEDKMTKEEIPYKEYDINKKPPHIYCISDTHIDAQIYKEITGEEPKDINIESFFEDGIHFGHQRVWKDDNDVWEY